MLASGCATAPPLDARRTAALPDRTELAATPFFPQTDRHCGPAALAGALAARGIPATPEGLSPTVYLPAREGSLPLDMLGGARRAGALALRIEPSLEALLELLAAGYPVVVLQNLSLSWYPMWHYALVIGYDRSGQKITLRSGRDARQVLPLGTFDRTWARSGRWAMIATRPGDIPPGAAAGAYTEAALALERTGQIAAARAAYTAGADHWPDELPLRIGLANVAMAAGDRAAAEQALREAVRRHPRSDAALNNLAHLLADTGRPDEAEALATAATGLRGPHEATARRTLEEIRATRTPPGTNRAQSLEIP